MLRNSSACDGIIDQDSCALLTSERVDEAANADATPHTASRSTARARRSRKGLCNVLLPLGRSEHALRAVEHLIARARDGGRERVHSSLYSRP